MKIVMICEDDDVYGLSTLIYGALKDIPDRPRIYLSAYKFDMSDHLIEITPEDFSEFLK